MQRNRGKNPFDEAPKLCVEILSLSNMALEMDEKKELYSARGAREFWVCDKEGNIKFYKNTGPLKHSSIIEKFPGNISVVTMPHG